MSDKRKLTIRELAQAAGVSIGTVSRALKGQSGLSTIRVDKEGMGYVAAMALIEGAITPDASLLPVELVVRESSRAAAPSRAPTRSHKARS
jgi:DNA-binding LacI/PurR family transcriptional regulator